MNTVTIRYAIPSDASALTRLYSQPETQAATLHLPYPSPSLWEQKLANPRAGVYMLVACLGEQVVGQLTLEGMTAARRRHCASLGMGVDPAFHRRGIGSALMAAMIDLCDNWLQVTRIELTVFADNDNAIALYHKFGFRIEGTAQGFAMREGALIDTHYMARLKT
ncbi:GNAT family N-acetyltransferase [Pantoea ananatis]|uniref:GNAT family N-acetyltransferase n=1 Tax=Pantoea ananas TaxID=553 RepID=UPI001B301B60|nr:GNAT family N-acetyltransferase [Pantoea ananatis]